MFVGTSANEQALEGSAKEQDVSETLIQEYRRTSNSNLSLATESIAL